VLLNGNGRCYLCREKIIDEWEAEHPVPFELTGDNEIAHLRPAHVECHKPKTHGEDRPRIRKAKNQEKLRLDVERTVSPAWGRGRGFGAPVRVPARKRKT
jgi:5-methylcytosine-specific restriction endonuclease McrA